MLEGQEVTATKLAYIAGLFDGEGTLVVGKYPRGPKGKLAYRGFMSLANTHVPTLQAIKQLLGGRIVEQGIGRQCFSLTWSTNEIRQWLPQLLPFLSIKKVQAEQLLAFLARQESNGFRMPSDDSFAFYEQCYQQLKVMKKVRYQFKEMARSLGIRACKDCGQGFPATSKSPKRLYCSERCSLRNRWTRYNRARAVKNRLVMAPAQECVQ